MGFTFDSPISISYTAQDKATRHKPTGIPLPPPKTKPKRKSLSITPSFLSKLRRSSLSSPQSAPRACTQTTPALESSFFRLPLSVRAKIYSFVLGRNEVRHVLLKRKASHNGYFVRFRRCIAGGRRDDCIVFNCKQFCDVVNGVYFGSFDSLGGLLLSCRDIYREARQVLYTQSTFDFDHPLSLLLFTQQIAPSSLRLIPSLSLDLGKYLYDPKTQISCNSLAPKQWVEAWDVVAGMEGLQEIRVRFRTPLDGWCLCTEKEVLEPLWKVEGVSVFEVEAPSSVERAFDGEERESEAPFTFLRDVQFPRR